MADGKVRHTLRAIVYAERASTSAAVNFRRPIVEENVSLSRGPLVLTRAAGSAGDLSRGLKNGSAQDDALNNTEEWRPVCRLKPKLPSK